MTKGIVLKFSKREYFTLLELLERTILQDASKTAEDRLLIAILLNVYKKVHNKAIELKDKYTLTLKAEEAIAFYLYYREIEPITIYENRLILITIEATDKHLL